VVYLAVLGSAAAGLLLTVAGAWRAGLSLVGAALLVGALARLALPERRAGMLRVRRKWSDVAMLTLAGVGLIVLAIVVPDQLPG
jgi:hypothetical protein